jgi:DNA gyrase/topoisomerase IV subunit A
MYSAATSDLPIDSRIAVSQLFALSEGETITNITSWSRRDTVDYFIFITKNGMIKKTAAKEYELKRGKSIKAISLDDGDEVIAVHFMNSQPVGILTSDGNCVIINTDEINAIGRVTKGVKAVKLNTGATVIDSRIITGDKLITVSSNGLIKKASLEEFPICTRGTKGKKISGVREGDNIVKFLTLKEDCDIIIISVKGTIKFNSSELKVLSRDATGVKAISLPDGFKVVDLEKA